MDSLISTAAEVRALRDQLDAAGKKLVFTSGCFDLLHVGHVRYLQQARALGDALVIALNSDASVRALKGPARPVTNQDDRAEILLALECVDRIVVFDEARTTGLIETIAPHIFSKGGDYTLETINPEERAALERAGAAIKILPQVQGRSTTQTLQRLKEGEAPADAQDQPLRLAVLGSGRGSNFEAIHQAIQQGQIRATVELVLSDEADSRILRKAREWGYPTLTVDPGAKGGRLSDAAQKEICDHLRRHDVELVVLAGFMRILKEPTLSEYKDRIVNIHPSLLPKFKGREAWKLAFEAGESEAGCTVHLVNAEIDSGRILAQKAVPILPEDTVETLYERIQVEEHLLLPRVLAEWPKHAASA